MKLCNSVRLQLTLWYVGTLSALIVIFGVLAYFSVKSILIRNIDATLYNGAKSLEQTLAQEYSRKRQDVPTSLRETDEAEDTFLTEELDEEANELFVINVVFIQVSEYFEHYAFPVQNTIKTRTLKDLLLPLSVSTYQMVKDRQHCFETVTGVFSFPLRMVSLKVYDMDEHPYVLQIALSLQEVQRTLHGLLMSFVTLFPILLIALSLVGSVFMKQAFSPVKKMVTLTRSITGDDLSLRLEPIQSRDEIGELADTLNDMIARLEESFKQMQQFSGDVSHELKTPLANLRCNAEIALRRERTPAAYQQTLANVIEDADLLRQIVEDLLLLARLDSQSRSLIFKPFALDEILFEVFESTHVLSQKKRLAIAFGEIQPVTILGDRGLLQRLLTNLSMNAIHYTPAGGSVTYSLNKTSGQAIVSISDTGIGIPEEALPYIFDRFYRVDPSRSHDTGGSGLGLAIVQKITEIHNGQLDVQSHVGQGTAFHVSLPCVSS